MDTRVALQKGTMLNHHNYGFCYEIKKELARGGSCIVYDAVYHMENGQEKTVKLKECYPFHLNVQRKEDGSLYLEGDEKKYFEKAKEVLRKAFYDGNSLFMTQGMTNVTSNTFQCFEENNTVYIPAANLEGSTLTKDSFTDLKDCVRIMITVAQVMEQIHKAGFLYLDLKPENIFVIKNAEGKSATELVQLFDFDSLIEVARLKNPDDKVFRFSYTQGYAALEHQMGSFQKFGYYTDVYSVGAVLFYLIFGRPPCAMDCEDNAVYNFAESKYGNFGYQDKLFFRLEEFFHHTLASYRFDRYETMGEVIEKLKEIVPLTDRTIPYLKSTNVIREKRFVGRKREQKILENWFFHSEEQCLFLNGMGGIGKSSFVRRFITSHEAELDSVFYLYYKGSLQEMIVDDFQIQVNTIEREKEEGVNRYFLRKLKAISKLLNGKKALLVIDDYSGELTKAFQQIMQVGWKVLVISRSQPPSCNYNHFELKALSGLQEQVHLFQVYSGYYLESEDLKYFKRITEFVQGHTLVLELLAKQIRQSRMTLKEAAVLIEDIGFADLIPEKVRCEKDSETKNETIREIISAVFFFHTQGDLKYRILKVLSLFQQFGVSMSLLCDVLEISSRDDFYDLMREGWIGLREDYISLHPVIKETIEGWTWKTENIADAKRILKYLYVNLESKGKQKSLDLEKMNLFLEMSEGVLKSCSKQVEIKRSELYISLLSLVLLHISVEKEMFISKYMRDTIDHPLVKNSDVVIRLYKRWVSVCLEQGKMKKAWKIIKEIEKYIRGRNHYVKAEYYDILGNFYDTRLKGEYACDNEYGDVMNMKKAIDRSIFHMKLTRGERKASLLCRYMLGKINFLVRTTPEKKREIEKMLKRVESILERNSQVYDEALRDYYMTKAFYHTLVEPDEEKVRMLCKLADDIVQVTGVPDIERIDLIYVPCANMMAEFEELELAADILLKGIQVCDQHAEMPPYIRKKTILYSYLLDVRFWQEDLEQCRSIMAFIDEQNSKREDYDMLIVIPDEIREFICITE